MIPTYNEEELLLRLLVGIVFPVLILVVLRLTRHGLRRWENRWRAQASQWLEGLLSRNGLRNSASKAGKAVSIILGLERILASAAALILLSIAWFVLFPQTRPLAQEFVQSILGPVLGLLGKILQALLLILYSVGLLLLARFASRYLAGKIKRKQPGTLLSLSLFSVPLRIGVWLLAAFLFLLPYPGMPRVFAVGLLIVALILVVFASRPLIEEVAIGLYLHSELGLAKGGGLKIDGEQYTILDLKPIHALLEKEGEALYIPYSRIKKATLSNSPEVPHEEP